MYDDKVNIAILIQAPVTPSSQAYLGGCLCVTVAVACWVAMAELLQGLEDSYDKPWTLSFVIHSFYVLLFPLWLLGTRMRRRSQEAIGLLSTRDHQATLISLNDLDLLAKIKSYIPAATGLGVVYTVGSYLWYISLKHTVASANNAIFQSSCAFIYLLSIPLLGEPFSWQKCAAIVVSLGGVVVVTLFHSKIDSVHDTVWGYVLVVLSTITFSVYDVCAAKYGPRSQSAEQRLLDSLLMLWLMGIANLVLMSPISVILDLTKVEPYQSLTSHQAALFALNVVLDIVFNVFLLFGITLTSPLFMSVGVMLVVPATMVTDVLVHSMSVSLYAVCGCLLIVFGFVLLHVDCHALLKRWCGWR